MRYNNCLKVLCHAWHLYHAFILVFKAVYSAFGLVLSHP
nr:DUF3265 domain-containing protein [Vibrio parahaemolyticus]